MTYVDDRTGQIPTGYLARTVRRMITGDWEVHLCQHIPDIVVIGVASKDVCVTVSGFMQSGELTFTLQVVKCRAPDLNPNTLQANLSAERKVSKIEQVAGFIRKHEKSEYSDV